MKPLSILVLLSAVVLALIAWKAPAQKAVALNQVPLHLSADLPAGHVVRAFEVEGICCRSCPTNLREAVLKIDGVEAVAVDPGTGRVEVETAPGTDTAALASALTFGEYVAHPLEAASTAK